MIFKINFRQKTPCQVITSSLKCRAVRRDTLMSPGRQERLYIRPICLHDVSHASDSPCSSESPGVTSL